MGGTSSDAEIALPTELLAAIKRSIATLKKSNENFARKNPGTELPTPGEYESLAEELLANARRHQAFAAAATGVAVPDLPPVFEPRRLKAPPKAKRMSARRLVSDRRLPREQPRVRNVNA